VADVASDKLAAERARLKEEAAEETNNKNKKNK
jgi:hypothetical protein